jgi:hypothetical protein
MLLHAAHAGLWDAVTLGRSLEEDDEVCLSLGVGKVIRLLAANEMARALGPEKAQALPMLHALTRCDTASCFAGHGKRSAWAAWTGQLCLRSHN